MFREIKPKKAKYAFKMDLGWDIKYNPATMVKDVLGEQQDRQVWFAEDNNNMGARYYTVYINDEDIYLKFKAAVQDYPPQPKLVLALPDYQADCRIVIASDEVIDGERLVCIAIKGMK